MPDANRRPASDSPEGRKATADWLTHCQTVEPELPPGQKKLTKLELYFYRQYLSSKLVWREVDKESLLRLIRIEADIDKLSKNLVTHGKTYIDNNGYEKARPQVAMLAASIKSRISHLSLLDIAATNGSAVDPLTVKKPRNTRGAKVDPNKADQPAGKSNLLRIPGR